ncbi:ComF family protein [Shewanella gaetbuli]
MKLLAAINEKFVTANHYVKQCIGPSLSHLNVVLARLTTRVCSSLPNRCMLCQQRIEQGGYLALLSETRLTGVCQYCLASGLYHTEVCLGCGRALLFLQPYCGTCLTTLPIKVVAPCSYHHGLGKLVSAIKYQHQMAAVSALTQQLALRIQQLVKHGLITYPQVIIPVPLHPNRLQQRGFNQAWLIAKELSRILSLPMDDTLVIRRIDTVPQAGLDGSKRRKNCQGAFELLSDLKSAVSAKSPRYSHVAIVDDVVTSGTTVNEIAHLLRQQSIASQVWCLARAEAPKLRC